MTAPVEEAVDCPTPEEIRALLIHHVVSFLECPESDIDPDVPLIQYGLDSIFALTLCGDIEDEYDIDIKSTLVWDHPTVNGITGYVHGILSEKAREI
ncbi:acyl carrier protein [Kitasatospora sp. NPDC059463]|uniref:acyl carrier protein n=1 Tax=unclassified Kitasatospora TaxID=2633591 RepID=UPI0036C1918A